MNIFKGIENLKLPDIKKLVSEGKDIKTQLKKIDINKINIRYFSRDGSYYIPTNGIIYRDTNISLVLMKVPENLGIILLDNTIHYNKFTKEEEIDVIEGIFTSININQGLDFSLNLNKKLNKEFDNIKKIIPKKEIKDVKNYTIPVMINQIPISITKTNFEKISKELPDISLITQKFLYEISTVKILQKVNKKKTDGLFIVLLLGVFIGIFIGMAFMGYILG